jgi:hypothetical protein
MMWEAVCAREGKILRVKTGEFLERETGIEPVTSSLGSWRSTAELLPPNGRFVY